MSTAQKDYFWIGAAIAVVLLGGAGAALYFMGDEPPPPAEPVAATPEPTAPVTPPVTTPPPVAAATTPPPAPAVPLPPLDQSDAELKSGLTELLGNQTVASFLVPERVVRNIVVTIDNVPREKVMLQQRPVRPTQGAFIAAGTEEAPLLVAENYARYKPFVAAVESVDPHTLVAFYRGLEPLFQQAYEDLGNPGASFDARLVEVIDHLLAAPELAAPIALKRPSVLYQYADERVETLSAGQKLLIRMGPENARALKARLRALRAALG